MKKLLNEYNYSRQFILLENTSNMFLTKLGSDDGQEQIDDYLWKVVTSVSQKEIDGKVFHMIQFEDKRLGWIELKDSLQIFRYAAQQYKIVEENFTNNEINKSMGIEKDFISHFKDKLLSVKSEIMFENQRYLSVFIKNKFHGFHHEDILDPVTKCNIDLSDHAEDFELFRQSNLTKPTENVKVDDMKMVAVFKKNRVGKVLVNNSEYYWISYSKASESILKQIDGIKVSGHKSIEKLELDDLIYSISQERERTKEILKSVLSAKSYLESEKAGRVLFGSNHDNSEMETKYKELKKDYDRTTLEYERKLRKSLKNLELSNKRLDYQKDYNERLAEQRDKYKSRMILVEEKLKKLNEKYKDLKEKYNQKKSKSNFSKFKSALKGDDK